MQYPFSSIHLNGREVSLRDILNEQEKGRDDFETHTVNFIRKWLSGAEEFELQTSGSTGTPKRIPLLRYQMEASARATVAALKLEPLFNAMVCLDTRYIAGQMMLVRCFVSGMEIHAVTPSADPLQRYNGKKIHFAAMVPYQLQSILKSAPSTRILDSMDALIIGGASVSDDIIQGIKGLRCKAFATFGMTETISHIALRPLNGPDSSDSYKILPGVEIDVDERSCLIVRGTFLREEVVTNDLVEILNPVTFRWIGRADNVINTGGVKVSPEALEQKLYPLMRSLNVHARFIVSSLPDRLLGEKVVVVFEAQNIDNESIAILTNSFRDSLQKFEIPKMILFHYPFPETASGKIDRRAIRRTISEQRL